MTLESLHGLIGIICMFEDNGWPCPVFIIDEGLLHFREGGQLFFCHIAAAALCSVRDCLDLRVERFSDEANAMDPYCADSSIAILRRCQSDVWIAGGF